VADTNSGLGTFRTDRVTETSGTGDDVVRHAGFDLDEAWRLIADEVDQLRPRLRVRASASPEIVGTLRWVLGSRAAIGSAAPDGRIGVELRSHDVRPLAGELAGFGAHLQIFEPKAVRDQPLRIGRELTATDGCP
jgi:predicted DNA-binding transcriptional regulator YafY